ncbi:unnamed protein product, partial [Scytosiphon promiscuus]
MIKPIVAGNWKMNGVSQSVTEINTLKANITENDQSNNCEILICPPATLI